MWKGGVRVVVPDENGRVLLACQKHEDREIWMLPGGGIEEDEDASQAAVREILEETGLVVDPGPLLWHVEEVSPGRGQRFVNFFLSRIIGGRLELGADPEREEQVLLELRFFSPAEMKQLPQVYPDWLPEELEKVMEKGPAAAGDPFRLRK
ncbi:MAG: NUDIX hydrolase [Bacillota bacterium]|nr:NUDIX hydrolase [Bacillota bacterium]